MRPAVGECPLIQRPPNPRTPRPHPPRILIAIIALAFTTLLGAQHARPEPTRHEFTRLLMGVEARIILYAPDPDAARVAASAAFDRIAAIEDVASDWRPSSEVMRLCAAPPGTPVRLSDDLFALLDLSQQLAYATNGAFDPTIGPVSRLWRGARESGREPSPAARNAALALVGFRNLSLDHAARTATLARPDMVFDLGGIAQGYAAAEALEALEAGGLPAACVDLSGDIALGDAPPGTDGWRVALPDPAGWRTLTLSNTAVSTSGDAEQFLMIEGQRESHIIQPATGRGVVGVRSVTIIAPDAALADALATALAVLGPDRGLDLARRIPDVQAWMLIESDDGAVTQHSTHDGFPSPR